MDGRQVQAIRWPAPMAGSVHLGRQCVHARCHLAAPRTPSLSRTGAGSAPVPGLARRIGFAAWLASASACTDRASGGTRARGTAMGAHAASPVVPNTQACALLAGCSHPGSPACDLASVRADARARWFLRRHGECMDGRQAQAMRWPAPRAGSGHPIRSVAGWAAPAPACRTL